MSANRTEPRKLEMDQLQIQLHEQIGGKKYLLVLDDVWNENREEWLKLIAHVNTGSHGSKILVTTRSRKVAKIMGTIPPYALGGLSEEESWSLFRMMAFEPGHEHNNPELEKLGKEIVKQCANVPLAIRTLGSLLYGEDESKWLELKERSPLEVSSDENGIMAILKLSYLSLWSPLKNCFAYCALFPKGYELHKETLISLWMAEGFLIPRHKSQSLHDVGEDYFSALFQRCFFQSVIRDKWGNIKSCKMHDLIHDLAKLVAGVESKVAKLGESDFDKRIHHLSFDYHLTLSRKIPHSVMNLRHIRTILFPEQISDGSTFTHSRCHELFSRFRYLRALDLHKLGIETLPSSVGELLHLRYLDLSWTPIDAIPDSITKLHRLQTLDLSSCSRLKRLPEYIGKLTNLKSLDLSYCIGLTHMPSGIGVLTSLHKLTWLLLGNGHPACSMSKANVVRLRDLKRLNGLRGSLEIWIQGELDDPGFDAMEAQLSSKGGLMELCISRDSKLYGEIYGNEYDEALLEGLKPHSSLKKLWIHWYRGEKLPSWAAMNNLCTSLPLLVDIQLFRCGRCQQVPSFSQLHSLKRLSLDWLQSVENMEGQVHDISLSPKEALFYPSLEELTLMNMDNLKSWWKAEVTGSGKYEDVSRKSFLNLSKLIIEGCPSLKSIPHCPKVEDLALEDVNESLLVLKKVASTSIESSRKLKNLCIDNGKDLLSLPKDSVSHLSSLGIKDPKLWNMCELREFFGNLHSLSCLKFKSCSSLESIFEGLEHLTTLEKLVIEECDNIDLSPHQGMDDGMPWKVLKNLQHLTICSLLLVALPSGLQHLTNLRTLEIEDIDELEDLPEWISCLTSLECIKLLSCAELRCLPEGLSKLTKLSHLEIAACPELTKRCRGPNGED